MNRSENTSYAKKYNQWDEITGSSACIEWTTTGVKTLKVDTDNIGVLRRSGRKGRPFETEPPSPSDSS